jgi:hypothetical protein
VSFRKGRKICFLHGRLLGLYDLFDGTFPPAPTYFDSRTGKG